MMASALAVCGVTLAQAQQVDGDFNQPWVQNTPWDSENGYYSGRADFTQPVGWVVSSVSGMNGAGATNVATQEVVSDGDYAVVIANSPNSVMSSQIIPGYMSLGTTWATAVSNIVSVSNADGGCFGGKEFAYRPDALRLDYKRSHGDGNASERASVIAYLWKGTYTQADVPGNTVLFSGVVKVDMTDRDRNILGKETAEGGAVTSTEDAALVASIEYYIDGDAEEWTPLEVPFTYADGDNGNALPEKLNIILAANDYFADRSTIGKDNKLTVDNVELVYWHALSALAYEGSTIEFNENTLAYDLSGVEYDEALLSYTVKGKGATASTSYNEETAVLSIRVEGNDFASNPESVTTYTIQFAVPVPAVDVTPIVGEYDSNLAITVMAPPAIDAHNIISLAAGEAAGTVDFSIKDFEFSMGGTTLPLGDINLTGVAVALGEDGVYTLTLDAAQTLALPGIGNVDVTLNSATVNAEGELNASLSISAMNGAMTVTVEVSPYVEEVPGVDVAAIVGDYKSKIVVEQGGMPGDPEEGNVALTAGAEPETVDFTVKDLNVLDMDVVDVVVTGVPVTMEEGVYTLETTGPQSSYQLYGVDGTVTLESATVTVSADKKELNATLSLEWNGMPMTVTITPAGEVGISDVAEGSDRIYAADGQIIAVVGEAKAITVVDLAGRTVYAAEATEGVNVISGLAEGIYIVNGEKVLVK